MSELSEAILRLRAEGKTYNQIKAELGCSKGTISYYLGVGQKEKSLTRQKFGRSKAIKFLQTLKSTTPCTDCGERYPYWVMDFDHLSDKEFGLAKVWGKTKSLDRIKTEIEKCEIVCANCHRDRTNVRQLQYISPHTKEIHDMFVE